MATETTLLIDGDVLIYRAAFGAEQEVHWGDDVWGLWCDLKEAKAKILSFLDELQETFSATHRFLATSCPTSEGFRRTLISPTYKNNRDDKRKPTGYNELRRWLLEDLKAHRIAQLEADDLLGIKATEPHKDHRILVSIDKDFRGVPCNFYNFNKPEEGVLEVSPEEAERFHAIQTLAGDATDGYSGCPGVGPKTAEKILAGLSGRDRWPAIVAAYAKAGLPEEEALLNARLARILRHSDYDRKKGTVRLWQPNL